MLIAAAALQSGSRCCICGIFVEKHASKVKGWLGVTGLYLPGFSGPVILPTGRDGIVLLSFLNFVLPCRYCLPGQLYCRELFTFYGDRLSPAGKAKLLVRNLDGNAVLRPQSINKVEVTFTGLVLMG